MSLIIREAKIIDPQSPFHNQIVDLEIENGTIKKIGSNLSNTTDVKELKLDNLHLSQGWFDSSVSLGEPGFEDRETIIKHNPIGTREEILLWMLLSILISYLSLSEIETPCFTGMPTTATYRQAILFILKDRKTEEFDAELYLGDLIKE